MYKQIGEAMTVRIPTRRWNSSCVRCFRKIVHRSETVSPWQRRDYDFAIWCFYRTGEELAIE